MAKVLYTSKPFQSRSSCRRSAVAKKAELGGSRILVKETTEGHVYKVYR